MSIAETARQLLANVTYARIVAPPTTETPAADIFNIAPEQAIETRMQTAWKTRTSVQQQTNNLKEQYGSWEKIPCTLRNALATELRVAGWEYSSRDGWSLSGSHFL